MFFLGMGEIWFDKFCFLTFHFSNDMFHILYLNVFPGDCLTCGNELKQFIAKRNYLETLYTSKKYPPTT